MKLTLRRSQASKGMILKQVQFSLNAQVHLTDQEAADVKKYKMGSEVIYSKDSMGDNEYANDNAGGMFPTTVDDLVRGKTINCKDILKMMAIVKQVKGACGKFKAMLEASAQFEGEEVLEYSNGWLDRQDAISDTTLTKTL